ncbi:50S ribosomal protein L21 [Candidatus Shapirobacteria bacterium CG10_big_fil_rev_8_21_14_0_10_40_9]|uniref:Large ribosomal subunit protein bL21 n=1 Tax=Candidatus Shapirobacteria bacterium CG10_big_fil_rev_8_21_14_0_10_40_9 TaxID=1974888 RepID=A0A2M8L482_9BACT|nr:MAG: 50S ribosomal protein L21 [Candidatus Shapirobacteria bacterium CG10_big_fil_rev_8_21_14_0_10_40_9]
MEYAVVKIGGSQYKIKEGDEFEVDRLPQKEGEEIELTEVLLVVDDGEVKIGQPQVLEATVKAKIISHFKGEKIRVSRFKAKSRYRKVRGFRPYLTKIKIEKIDVV